MKYPEVTTLVHYWFFILPFHGGQWSYKDPDSWKIKYPQCGWKLQSPIALDSRTAQLHPSLHLRFYNYEKQLFAPVEIINNGYSAAVGVRINQDRSLPFLTIGDSTDRFEVQGVHFHWGSKFDTGSEHTLDGIQYNLEMHIVHKNNKYNTVEEARDSPDGFVVLGVLFRKFQPGSSHQTLLAIYNSLPLISQYKSIAELKGAFTMSSFLPDLNRNKFFAYKGSLTTPPCIESVSWFVFSEILPISNNDLDKFFNIFDFNNTVLWKNFRPIQETNGRVVFLANN